jgi:hypothetical protein
LPSWFTSPVLTVALVVLAGALVGLAVRACRRDTQWLRDRRPGPLDSVPLRAKAKRIHLGLRVASVAGVLAVALATVVAHG